MKLIPPYPPESGRCEWMFKRHYQCSEPASHACPTLTDAMEFKWAKYCPVHKTQLEIVTASIGPAERIGWQEIKP